METSDGRQDQNAPGGVGTIIRPGAEPGTRGTAGPVAAPPARPGERRGRRPGRPGQPLDPREPQGRPAVWTDERGAQRRARTEDGGYRRPGGERGKQSERDRQSEWDRQPARRMPFILLLCGLLGGALISALVISTTLAAGSYQITRLQQANNALARQRQILQEQVAAAQSAQVIQERALKLGMRPVGELRFLNLKTGKVQADAGSGAVGAINVPGYIP